MDELANQLNYVLGHFGIKSFIGFGVGAGANIFARFALAYPQKVDNFQSYFCSTSYLTIMINGAVMSKSKTNVKQHDLLELAYHRFSLRVVLIKNIVATRQFEKRS